VIDIGPKAAPKRRACTEGTPEQVAREPRLYTGHFLGRCWRGMHRRWLTSPSRGQAGGRAEREAAAVTKTGKLPAC
jgi:hypothetical protein